MPGKSKPKSCLDNPLLTSLQGIPQDTAPQNVSSQ